MNFVRRAADNVIVALAGWIPARVARHVLFLLRSHSELLDRWGYHVRPIHFYEPLPDFRQLLPAQLDRRRDTEAVVRSLVAQQELVRRLGATFAEELTALRQESGDVRFDFQNDYFSGVDAALYYSLLRDLRPRRVIEIGCGFSTQIASRALQKNAGEGHRGTLTCIEPFPEARLTGARLEMELIERPVQEVALDQFRALESGDVLFIDSSHSVKFGSDVCRELLEILPVLAPGTWIHFHDIFFPFEYPREWLTERRLAFNEQYMLEAFLAYNEAFTVEAAVHWLWREHRGALSGIWPCGEADSDRHGGASFWIRKVQDAAPGGPMRS